MLPASYSFGLPCVFTVGGARLVFFDFVHSDSVIEIFCLQSKLCE